MTIVFIVVGAVAYLAVSSAGRHSFSTNSIEGTTAVLQVQAAYDTLGTATQTFKSATQSCSSAGSSASTELQCLEQADSTWAQAIQDYAAALGQISYPSSAQSEVTAARAAAANATNVVRALAASSDAQAYSAASSGQAFTSALDAVDSTSNTLVNNLQGA